MSTHPEPTLLRGGDFSNSMTLTAVAVALGGLDTGIGSDAGAAGMMTELQVI